jgi:non-specific serine/threonine protein kinase/serine/threonine-protein kinase
MPPEESHAPPSPQEIATAVDGRGEGRLAAPPHGVTAIGPYRIVGLLGEGGMGTVFLAEQLEPVRRRVALKVVRAAHLSCLDRQLRFEGERRALARLTHPNVAQLYDAGTTPEGNPYFVMELVEGPRITAFCDERRLGLAERLRLFLAVCDGVQHAHQKGVVHRDLKPSNILVADQGGRPLPKVIDFGIAKALDQPLVESELTVGLVGTPGYVSPESISELAGPAEADTRSDVYSLGVLLYELLTGVLPFAADVARGDARGQMLRQIRDLDPPGPSARFARLETDDAEEIAAERGVSRRALGAELGGDLDWVVLKAIARDRELRYASVSALADDVERHLSHRPVEAGPPSFWYRTRKLVRRRRGAVAAAALLTVALVGGFIARSIEATRANRAAAEAERARVAAETARGETEKVAAFLVSLFAEADPEKSRGKEVTARELLDRGAERIRGELDETPVLRARLLHTIAGVYQRLGLYREARPLAIEALELRERELGADDLLVAQSLRTLGIIDVELGDRDAAGELFQRVLAIREKVLGPDHPDVGDALGNLGFFLMQQKRFDEAQPLLERAVEIRRATLGENHPRVAPTLYNLALLHQTQKRYELAEPLHRRALEIDTQAYGEDHPAVAQGLYGLGDLYLAMRRLDDAEDYLRRALAAHERLYGPENIQTSFIHLSLGEVAFERGRFEEAQREYEHVLRVQTDNLPTDHPDRLEVIARLAKVAAARRP